jgi:elongation factor P--(R)-beta-lysine ligase
MTDLTDHWRPACEMAVLRIRAAMLRAVRTYFGQLDYLEVETPMLGRDVVVDAWIDPFRLDQSAGGRFLQTSPEAGMKRLLAAGADSIHQICKVFRRGESGQRHNPEFTMVEWYGVNSTLDEQMRVTEGLVRAVIQAAVSTPESQAFPHAWRDMPDLSFLRTTYDMAFHRCTGQFVLDLSTDELLRLAAASNVPLPTGKGSLSRDELLNAILAAQVEPQLGRGRPEFVFRYPASQAALAELCLDDPRVAQRCELYVDGIELCNGYQELTNTCELRSRDARQNTVRADDVRSTLPGAPRMMSAMDHGLPRCAGVALGFDRLVMLALGCHSIRDVIPFPWDRA